MTSSLRSESERMEDLCKKLQEDEESLQEKISKKVSALTTAANPCRINEIDNIVRIWLDTPGVMP